MPFNYNSDGSIRPFTPTEIDSMGIDTLGVEDGDHPTFTREVSQNTMRARYVINADQLDNFICFMLGGQVVYPSGATFSGAALSRLPPQGLSYGDVDYSNYAAVKVESATGRKILTDDTDSNDYPIPEYNWFDVTILFQQMPFNVLDDEEANNDETTRYLQQLPSSSQVDYLGLPGGIARYITPPSMAGVNPNGIPIPYAVGFPTALTTISYKWIRLPFATWGVNSYLYFTLFGDVQSGAIGLIGTVNSQEFLGYPPGVLLMLAPEEELVLDPTTNELSWNLTYKFLVKWAGHNWFYYWPAGTGTVSTPGGKPGWYFVNAAQLNSPYYGMWFTDATCPDFVGIFNTRNFDAAFDV